MKKIVAAVLGTLLLAPTMAAAGPFPPNVANDTYGVAQGGVVNGTPTANDDNDAGPDINDAINQLQGTAMARNVNADPLFMALDETWTESGLLVILVGLSAGNANTLGVYTDIGVGAAKTSVLGPYSGFGFLGDGSIGNPYPAAYTTLSVGTTLGWYLNSVDGGSIDYYSEAALNPAGYDHMMTFDLPGANGTTVYVDTGSGPIAVTLNDPFLICWEDLPWDPAAGTLGDDDYDDMMYLVDVRQPRIPAPGAAVLGALGTGLVGWMRRRRML